MGNPATNLASMARGVLRWANERGISESDLLGRAAPPPLDGLDGNQARIPREAHVQLWRSLEAQFGDPDFGLNHAETLMRPASLGVVGLLSMTSANVAESVHRATTYSRILKPDVRSRSYFTDRHLVVELETQAGSPRSVADCSMVAYLLFLRRWTGEDFPACEVRFQHPRPSSIAAYERWFRCTVKFGHACNAIAFDREIASLPLRSAQPDVAAYLEEQAAMLLARVPRDEPREVSVEDVRAAVRAAVLEGDAQLTVIARHLGAGARQLQRLLAKHGLEFRALLDEARHAAALPLVTENDTPFEIISERIGFAAPRALHRAFRRWVGVSPSELRQHHRQAERAGRRDV